tara:strand:+ start:4095 stop:4541 length:447 start_codon:yes stop_codon:yes gene_type:complete
MNNDAQLSFNDRNVNRTNAAEECAIEYFDNHKYHYLRYGFDEKNGRIESKIWWSLPDAIRSSPDFIVVNNSAVFFEAKGYRGDLKIKVNDLINYEHWDKIMPLWLYVKNFDTNKEQVIEFKELRKYIYECDTGKYADNGKTYFILKKT